MNTNQELFNLAASRFQRAKASLGESCTTKQLAAEALFLTLSEESLTKAEAARLFELLNL